MTLKAGTADGLKAAEWATRRERGSLALLKIMAFISLRFGRSFSRTILYAIAAYFFAFGPSARRHSRQYLSLALRRTPRPRDRFQQILSFATTIHDRVYLINGRDDAFNITHEGEANVLATVARGGGALLLGAHMGSFEVIRSLSRHERGIRVAMAMYEENARKISGILAAINPAYVPEIISLGHIDAMINIAERLKHGWCVGVLGDRTLGAEPVQSVTLLGETAYLPTGPMRAAAILRCPVFFMAGLYRGTNNYHVVFEPIADFSTAMDRGRGHAVHAAVERYASLLDRYCRSDPYNWFNFFDFWRRPPEYRST